MCCWKHRVIKPCFQAPGHCQWMQTGLPVLSSVTVPVLERLLEAMSGSKAIVDAKAVNETSDTKAATTKEKPAVRLGRRKASHASVPKMMTDSGTDGQADFLTHLRCTMEYLYKVDNRQVEKIKSFTAIGLYAAVHGSVDLTIKGTKKTYGAWSTIRKLMKAEVYRAAQLRPRISDTDFADLDVDAKNDDGAADNDANTFNSKVHDAMPAANDLRNFVVDNRISDVPLPAQMFATSAVNSTMLAVFAAVSHKGGTMPSEQDAFAVLLDAALTEVLRVIPLDWDIAAALLDNANDNYIAKEHEPFQMLLSIGMTTAVLNGLRMSLACHILACLGLQHFNKSDGAGSPPTSIPYMSSQMHKFVADLGKKFDMASKATWRELPELWQVAPSKLGLPWKDGSCHYRHTVGASVLFCVGDYSPHSRSIGASFVLLLREAKDHQ